MRDQGWRWVLRLVYIFAVATIWTAASFVVQSVVDEGVSPFLVTYICNSLFVVYIPLVEIGRYLECRNGSIFSWLIRRNDVALQDSKVSEEAILLPNNEISNDGEVEAEAVGLELDVERRWTHWRVSKVSILISPIWFMAQLTFNLSLKYTTVTSNTILSSASSLFTFLVALVLLGEKFAWLKLISVLLCMGGVIIVSLGDSGAGANELGLFNTLTGKQFGLIVGKGLLNNVVSDYLWAKAVLLTTTTVASAGLSIQVPLAIIVDSLRGIAP
ncbi:hypothetical protein SASPL_135368 [Salvia splendens]|uniref:EamA domain-containing protein n=1 Tax=Salvia splendens TaxID=180675 RepID=A0A8X8ZFM4_SALSN|nr:hypothetical protein SASPL_135368 [Salvia splendens]